MRYAGIDKCDLCNGNDIGMSLYVQGCNAHCENCFNPETWDFNGGEEWTDEIENEFFTFVNRPYIKRVSFLGGEPLAPENIEKVSMLITNLKRMYPEKQIWVYTGYDFKYLKMCIPCIPSGKLINLETILNTIDYLVDGRYVDALHDAALAFRGSSNQIIWHRENDKWVPIDL